MASNRLYANERRQSGAYSYSSANHRSEPIYMYGNVVTKPERGPERRKSPTEPKKRVSRQVQRNRKRALHMNAAYVVFLAVAATVALLLCVNYVRLQSEMTKSSKQVTALRKNLQI